MEELRQFKIKLEPQAANVLPLDAGAYGKVYGISYNGAPCTAKSLHNILMGRGDYESVCTEQTTSLLAKFLKECILHSKLRHPNIVQFIGVEYGDDPENYDIRLVMERMDTNLESCLEAIPNIPLAIKLSVLCDVSAGLLYLHSFNPPIIHGDLTTTNILLTHDWRAKIADFGNSVDENILSTAPGALIYMPPEAFEKPLGYDTKLDIFSFGTVSLFVGLQVKACDYGKRDELIQRLSAYQQLKSIYQIVTWCCEKDQRKRPTSMDLNTRLQKLCPHDSQVSNMNMKQMMESISAVETIAEKPDVGKIIADRKLAEAQRELEEMERGRVEDLEKHSKWMRKLKMDFESQRELGKGGVSLNTNIRSEGAYNYYHCIDPVALSLYEDANKASKRGKDTPIPEQTSVHPKVEQNRGPSSSSSPGQKLKEQFFKPSKTKSSLPVATPPEIRSNVISKEERMKNQAPFGLQGVPTSKMNNELKAFLSDLDEPKEKSREGSPTSSPPIPSGKEAPPTKRNTMGPLTILAMPSATHSKAMLSTTHPKATPSVTHPNLSRQPPELGWERVIPRSSWILSPSDAIKQNLSEGKADIPKPHLYNQQMKEEQDRRVAVQATMSRWYHPPITREAAIAHVQKMAPGSFIVRDSQSVRGDYSLTMKVSGEEARKRNKLPEGTSLSTEMCVTHFLIGPDPAGVKLKGWNEPPFLNITEFIAQHTVKKLCLPCLLVLPEGEPYCLPCLLVLPEGEPYCLPCLLVLPEAHVTETACDLMYLGSVGVASSPGSDDIIASCAHQLKMLEPLDTIITFEANKERIVLKERYTMRHLPVACLTYCGLDIGNARCFGVVAHTGDPKSHSCHIFEELKASQPVTAVVLCVQRIMKQSKNDSIHE